MSSPAPLQVLVDPTDSSYLPLPDWYFLFLYELLKYDFASGPYVLLGILVIPGVAFGALFLAPFLDNGPGRRPPKRPIAVAMMLLALVSVGWLTYDSASAVDWQEIADDNKPIPESEQVEVNMDDPGYEIYADNCLSCHGDDLSGGPAGPRRRPPKRPIAVAMMLLALVSVGWLTYDSASAVDWQEIADDNKPIPESEQVEVNMDDPGYEIYADNCLSCHGDDLSGGPAGPGLLGSDHDAEEVEDIAVNGIGDMPADIFEGSDEELKEIAEFLEETIKEEE